MDGLQYPSGGLSARRDRGHLLARCAYGRLVVGFSGDGVIYDGKVWSVVSRDERKDGRGQWVIAYDGEQLAVEVGKEKRGTRRITVGKEPSVECSLITGAALPDYPVEDLREGFKDNGYRADDSVTFVGWMKDMPAEAWEKGRSVEILRNNIFMDKQESFVAAMDSTGRFSVRVPLVNTSEIYIDIGRKGINTVVEPGETYFLLHDFSTGHVLFMGEDVRLQNELQTHPPLYVDGYLRKGQGTVDEFRIQMEEKYRHAVEELSRRVEEHPNLSRRYRYYMESFCFDRVGSFDDAGAVCGARLAVTRRLRGLCPDKSLAASFQTLYALPEFWHIDEGLYRPFLRSERQGEGQCSIQCLQAFAAAR